MNQAIRGQVMDLAAQLAPRYWEARCSLHMNPEPSFAEEKTSEFVQQHLEGLGISFTGGWAGHGVVAVIKGHAEGNVVGLRADLDALPIHEQNDVAYRSQNEGWMHACGHDFHTACLLGVAEALHTLRNQWAGEVVLIFQPGEERLPGGASQMIEQGVLHRHKPHVMLAQHVTPEISAGEVGFKQGRFMASTDEIYITVTGKGGHAAMPASFISPIIAASNLVLGLEKEFMHPVSQAGMHYPTVFTIGKFEGLGATNVVPKEVKLEGTFRTFNEQWRKACHNVLQRFCLKFARKNHVEVDLRIVRGYPCLVNHPELTAFCEDEARQYLGEERVHSLPLRMTAEDFAFFSERMPVCFYRIGTGGQTPETRFNVHHPNFDVAQESMETALGLMTWLTLNALTRTFR